MFHACQAGYEAFLIKELDAHPAARGAGWIKEPSPRLARDLCFAHYSLERETELAGESGRKLAQALVEYFLETSRGVRYDAPWPLAIEGGGEAGAAKRAHTVQEHFLELAKKRVARVIKLAATGRPAAGAHDGLFVYLTGLDRAVVSRRAVFGGQRRMADDPQAPSRSYLKVEEAYAVMGLAPKAGETVVDLGAAPGGWSFSAAKRGAQVVAVDNGPLKGGANGNPLIRHSTEDAFRFQPGTCDWLFCDMIEDPERVLELLNRWVAAGACRRFIVNLKFGRTDPLPLLRKARALPVRGGVIARHLYHDRDEFTVLGAS